MVFGLGLLLIAYESVSYTHLDVYKRQFRNRFQLHEPLRRLQQESVELGGVGELHAAFLKESRTRGHCRCQVTGNPGTLRSG